MWLSVYLKVLIPMYKCFTVHTASVLTIETTECQPWRKPWESSPLGFASLGADLMSQNINAFWKGSTLIFMQSHHKRMSVSVVFLRAGISRGQVDRTGHCKGQWKTLRTTLHCISPDPSSGCPAAIPMASPHPDSSRYALVPISQHSPCHHCRKEPCASGWRDWFPSHSGTLGSWRLTLPPPSLPHHCSSLEQSSFTVVQRSENRVTLSLQPSRIQHRF